MWFERYNSADTIAVDLRTLHDTYTPLYINSNPAIVVVRTINFYRQRAIFERYTVNYQQCLRGTLQAREHCLTLLTKAYGHWRMCGYAFEETEKLKTK